MKIRGVEVDEAVYVEYVETMKKIQELHLPMGVQMPYLEQKRRDLHEQLLDTAHQSRGSDFEKALIKQAEGEAYGRRNKQIQS